MILLETQGGGGSVIKHQFSVYKVKCVFVGDQSQQKYLLPE